MADYGLTETGFVIEPLLDIQDEILADLRADHGPSFAAEGTAMHKIVGVFAERISTVWELAEDLSGGLDPDAATGTQLEALAALTGTERDAESKSRVDLTLTGTPATVVPAGSRASAESGVEFATLADGTIALLASWASGTAYALGDRRTNAARAYECITAGTSAGSGGPTTTDDDITDNTAHWRYLGEGTGATDVDSECTEVGPTVATSGEVVNIETPISGWSSVLNLLDADVGSDVETDESLRVSRVEELAAPGTTTEDALKADLLEVEGVTSVKVFSNRTDTTDADGVPPHAVECLVRGGDDQDIWQALYELVSATSGTHGTEVGNAVDSEDNEHEMKFSRPDEVEIYVIANLTYNAKLYPTDGDDQIKAAIVAWGDGRDSGDDVHSSAGSAQCFQVAGVLNVATFYIGTAPAPASEASITIGTRELATFDTSRISINATPATP